MEIKVPFYHIVNMLLAGLVLITGGIFLFPDAASNMFSNVILKVFSTSEVIPIICFVAISYETGLIISRIGSVLIETILKKLHWIPYNDDYVKFNKKKNKNPIMHTLSREYALSRTGIAVFLALAIMALFSATKLAAIPFVLIAIIFYTSCRKHAKKIIAIMNEPEENNNAVKA